MTSRKVKKGRTLYLISPPKRGENRGGVLPYQLKENCNSRPLVCERSGKIGGIG